MLPKLDNDIWWKLPKSQRMAIQKHKHENYTPKSSNGINTVNHETRNTNTVTTDSSKQQEGENGATKTDNQPNGAGTANQSSVLVDRKAKFIRSTYMSRSRNVQIKDRLTNKIFTSNKIKK